MEVSIYYCGKLMGQSKIHCLPNVGDNMHFSKDYPMTRVKFINHLIIVSDDTPETVSHLIAIHLE